MTTISAKIIEAFRNLKSDAVPRSPRPQQETPDDVTRETHNHNSPNESEYTVNDPEEIFVNPESTKKDKKQRKQKNKEYSDKPTNPEKNAAKTIAVNTQATGYVVNIVDSPGCQYGNNYKYCIGPNTRNAKGTEIVDSDEEHIEKTNEITLLMEATVKPEYVYIDYVSKNLGKNWHRFFRRLGYTKGRIETFEIDESRNGVSEARYQLLLDWIRNEDDATLGRLVSLLWAEGERSIVKELSIIYSTNNKI